MNVREILNKSSGLSECREHYNTDECSCCCDVIKNDSGGIIPFPGEKFDYDDMLEVDGMIKCNRDFRNCSENKPLDCMAYPFTPFKVEQGEMGYVVTIQIALTCPLIKYDFIREQFLHKDSLLHAVIQMAMTYYEETPMELVQFKELAIRGKGNKPYGLQEFIVPYCGEFIVPYSWGGVNHAQTYLKS